ncbi:MAG: hypothetical protein ACFE8O_08435 [Candidatus Hermodarchaeota archaeon]
MVRNKTQLVVILLLVTLIPMATFAFLPSQLVSGFSVSRILLPGTTTVYEDDFSTTTYLDGGSTTAEGWGTGALTSPRNYQIQSLDNYTAGYQCRSLDVQGRKVYATHYSGGASSIDILDITNPANIFRCDDRSAAASMTASEVDGQIWYVGTEGSFLAAYNVSDPFNIPGPEDSFNIGDGRINDIEVQGHFLYVAMDSPGDVIQIYDVEDPSNMVLVLNLVNTNYHIYGLEVAGDLVYMAHGGTGLVIWNMTTPYDGGSFVSLTDTAGDSMDVLVDGNLAYVADGAEGVLIFDVSDPTSPDLLGTYDTPGTARRLALHGNTLYVADYTGGLIILDVADPTHPTYVDSITYDDTWDVCLYGPYVVIGTDYGVHTISIGNGIRVPEHYGTYSGVYDILDVRVQNDIAYIAAGASGLLTVDVSDPTNPIYLDNHTASAGRFYKKLDIQGHKAFVADYGSGGGVRIYDISDPTNLTYLGRYALTYATDVAVAGDTIFVADGTAGLYIANVSDPYSPAHITGIGGIGNITAVDVQGHYVYVVGWGGGGNGIYMYDITDISTPQLASTEAVINEHWDIFVDGGYYLGANNRFFYAANITNPYNYHLAHTPMDWSWNASGVWGYGPYAIMASGLNGTLLWNTTDIYNMNPMGTYTGSLEALAVTISGDFAYIANNHSLHICRIYTSPGYHYVPGSTIAQSTAIDSTTEQIVSATLTQTAYIPAGTSASWFLSADGGGNWEPCTPGMLHTFNAQGSDLRYLVELITGRTDSSAHIYNITVSYTHTQPPSAPALTDPGTEAPAGNIVISWAASSDPDGTIDHYELQSGNDAAFTIVHATYTTPDTNYTVGAPTSGVFFFRVRAIDDDGAYSGWSNVEDITITGGLPPPIPGFPIEAIAIGALIALGGGIVYRRRKR